MSLIRKTPIEIIVAGMDLQVNVNICLLNNKKTNRLCPDYAKSANLCLLDKFTDTSLDSGHT